MKDQDIGETSQGSASSTTSGFTRPHYRRRNKPPFSYAELISLAILSSDFKKRTLREICEYLECTFPVFQGEYTGWRNSVRHNLSASGRFVKVLRDRKRPFGKDNYWAIKPNTKHDIQKMQERLDEYLSSSKGKNTANERKERRPNTSPASGTVRNKQLPVAPRQKAPHSGVSVYDKTPRTEASMDTYRNHSFTNFQQPRTVTLQHDQYYYDYTAYQQYCAYQAASMYRYKPSDSKVPDQNSVTTAQVNGSPCQSPYQFGRIYQYNRDQMTPLSETAYLTDDDESMYTSGASKLQDPTQMQSDFECKTFQTLIDTDTNTISTGAHVVCKTEDCGNGESTYDSGSSDEQRGESCMYDTVSMFEYEKGTFQTVSDILNGVTELIDDTSLASLTEMTDGP
ncbi:uncharacterized protein LOC102802926 [Saccoglossus kowalevskii]|uniref:Forkhead box protein I2-B-like n=1 Tax=Saccoglossus kowalevskii TaxID=10224 RepID=A0ABM0M2S1_SACKO|nr:PREDICTED: forkhead box protein I2-B-like [Saccoglossus kowalevskii]